MACVFVTEACEKPNEQRCHASSRNCILPLLSSLDPEEFSVLGTMMATRDVKAGANDVYISECTLVVHAVL
jgi:FixJ family two-component response regulator